MPNPRRKITLTIWQWPTGEVTAFLDSLRVDGAHLEMDEPRLVAQTTVPKGAEPAVVLAHLAASWNAPVRAQEGPSPA